MPSSTLPVLLVSADAAHRATVRRWCEAFERLQCTLDERTRWSDDAVSLSEGSFRCCLLDVGERTPDQMDHRLPAPTPEAVPTARIPIIVLSASGDSATKTAWLREGAYDVLPWAGLDAGRLEDGMTDTLARHQAETGRLRLGSTYRAIVENAQDIITVVDRDGTIRYESPSIERALGYGPTELVGQNAFAFIHPDDMPDVIGEFDYGVEHPGYTASIEFRFRHKNGSWRRLESRAKSLLDDPTVAGIVVNSRDITERHAMELALRRSEQRNRALLDAIPDAMVRIARDGTYQDVHLPREYTSFTDPLSLIGKRADDVLPPQIARQAMACVEEALRTGRIQTFEYEIEVEGGERRVREARVMMCGEDEVISIQRDVTKRKRAEEALRKSEAMLRTVVSNIPVILFVIDRHEVFTLSEGKGLDALGAAPGDAVGRSVVDLYGDRPGFVEDVRRALAGETFSSLVEVSGRAFECWFSPLARTDGSTAGCIGVAADITETKRREAELRESQEQLRELAAHLQSVREAERTRISREVHDVLGQSLTALRMDVSWIEKGLPDDFTALDGRIASMKELIDTTIQTVRRIASDLRPGILDDLGLSAALEWQAQHFEERTGIVCHFSDQAGAASLDRQRSTALFRVFQEVLTNVARHADARTVDITLHARPGDVFKMTVTDDGKGISEADMENRRSLGLLGMRERLMPWQGTVRLSGIAGQGTTVEVAMPLTTLAESTE